MYIFGDCHIGANRRNKFHHRKGYETWNYLVRETSRYSNDEAIMFAGDLWDSDRPTPYDLVLVKETLENIITDNPRSRFMFIPGNHDRINIDGVCAANIFDENLCDIDMTTPKYFVFTEGYTNWREGPVDDSSTVYCFLPYSADILEKLKELSDKVKKQIVEGKYNENHIVLISHFTTKEMNPFAGIISEYDEVFNPFDVVVLGDCHIVYDNGKFHTTGSTYMFNVDEMNSKRCIPSFVHIDDITGEFNRYEYPEFKPTVIDDESEAVDDNTLYLIISSEVINVTKPNVFVKYKPNKDTEDDSVELNESVEIKSINKDKVFEIMYPELNENERKLIKMFANGEIEIQDVIDGKIVTVVGRNEVSEVELEAELEGLLNEEGF